MGPIGHQAHLFVRGWTGRVRENQNILPNWCTAPFQQTCHLVTNYIWLGKALKEGRNAQSIDNKLTWHCQKVDIHILIVVITMIVNLALSLHPTLHICAFRCKTFGAENLLYIPFLSNRPHNFPFPFSSDLWARPEWRAGTTHGPGLHYHYRIHTMPAPQGTQLLKLCAFAFGEMYDALSCSTRHSTLQWISITTSIYIRVGISLNIIKAIKLPQQ